MADLIRAAALAASDASCRGNLPPFTANRADRFFDPAGAIDRCTLLDYHVAAKEQ